MRVRAKYNPDLENLEIELLGQAIRQLHGIDLLESSPVPIRRKIWEAVRREKTRTISGLQERLLHDGEALEGFLKSVLPKFIPYDAGFLQAFRFDIVPLLRTYPFVRLWQIGCHSVFEIYSLAIILLEEGLEAKATLYATDVNEAHLQNCRDGVFLLAHIEKYEKLYKKGGGRKTLSHYFSGGGQKGMFDPALRRNMVFSRHNLATDSSMNEFNTIFCRNPLRHYNRRTQLRAHSVVYDSLALFGILGLSPGETLDAGPSASRYSVFDPEHNLYRKIA